MWDLGREKVGVLKCKVYFHFKNKIEREIDSSVFNIPRISRARCCMNKYLRHPNWFTFTPDNSVFSFRVSCCKVFNLFSSWVSEVISLIFCFICSSTAEYSVSLTCIRSWNTMKQGTWTQIMSNLQLKKTQGSKTTPWLY